MSGVQPSTSSSRCDAAAAAVRVRGDERERSFVAAIEARIRRPGPAASAQLLTHIRRYGEDALAVSIAVPTIAFGGATEVPQEAWSLVEGLAPAYGSDWWYAGMLAFMRQEQERWDEAAELSERALAEVPSSGHAVHARAHVYYETGDHDRGLAFLDPWIDSCGRAASHRAHFAWHAALHELSMGDDIAVRRRYAAQLAPPAVTGMRALVDSASLLWRAQLAGAWSDEVPIDDVLSAVDPATMERPRTAFAALHVAVARAAGRGRPRVGPAGPLRRVERRRRDGERRRAGRPRAAAARRRSAGRGRRCVGRGAPGAVAGGWQRCAARGGRGHPALLPRGGRAMRVGARAPGAPARPSALAAGNGPDCNDRSRSTVRQAGQDRAAPDSLSG